MNKIIIPFLLFTTIFPVFSDEELFVEPDQSQKYLSERKWTPYLGPDKVSEIDFYSIAGRELDALRVQRYRKKRRNVIISEIALTLACTATAVAVVQYDNLDSKASVYTYIGSVMGGFTGLLSIPFTTKYIMPSRYTPYQYASNVADEYNGTVK